MESIEDELNRLAADVEVPLADPADDLARGRARLRRRRAGVGGAAVASLAVAAVIGGVALAGGGAGGRADEEPGYAGQSDATSELSGSEAVEQVRERHAEEPAAVDPPDSIDAALLVYRDVVAEYLDPSGEHLQKRPNNEQSGGGGAPDDVYLGTKLGWSNPGQDGLGMVQVGVASSQAALDGWWPCGAYRDQAWTCRQATDETGKTYETASSGRAEMILVRRTDGLLVVITLDALFGNNSLVPVEDFGFAAELVVAAASDPRIQLPEGYDPQLEH